MPLAVQKLALPKSFANYNLKSLISYAISIKEPDQ
jgi:hypothetical protein